MARKLLVLVILLLVTFCSQGCFATDLLPFPMEYIYWHSQIDIENSTIKTMPIANSNSGEANTYEAVPYKELQYKIKDEIFRKFGKFEFDTNDIIYLFDKQSHSLRCVNLRVSAFDKKDIALAEVEKMVDELSSIYSVEAVDISGQYDRFDYFYYWNNAPDISRPQNACLYKSDAGTFLFYALGHFKQ